MRCSSQSSPEHCCSKKSFVIFIVFQIFSGVVVIHWGRRLQYFPDWNGENRKLLIANTIQQKQFSNSDKFTLLNDTRSYFTQVTEELTCFTEGTNITLTITLMHHVNGSNQKISKCRCVSGYYGLDCGIPDAVWHSRYRSLIHRQRLKRRKVPRRVINGIPLLKEIDMLEARFHELGDVVDLFMLAESNYSAHGDPKKLYIRNELNNGFLSDYHDIIMHIFVDFFPERGRTNSWVADEYLREYMGRIGIPRVIGVQDDDLFIINDADEIPSRPLVLFLKLYDGYTEPISLVFRWSVYGYFWKQKQNNFVSKLIPWDTEKTNTLISVATMGLVTKVMDNNPMIIRIEKSLKTAPFIERLAAYKMEHPKQYQAWQCGAAHHYAGWHCSWCFEPAGIVLKLDSAQAGDLPRWGDYPEKHDHKYIQSLIDNGRWFDGSSKMFLANRDEAQYAPPYFLENPEKYASILDHASQKRIQPKHENGSTTKSEAPTPTVGEARLLNKQLKVHPAIRNDTSLVKRN